jgi:hypothetical protein
MTRENTAVRDPKLVAPRFTRRFSEPGPWTTRRVPLGTVRYRRNRRPEIVELNVAMGQLGHALRNAFRQSALIRWLSRLSR